MHLSVLGGKHEMEIHIELQLKWDGLPDRQWIQPSIQTGEKMQKGELYAWSCVSIDPNFEGMNFMHKWNDFPLNF